MDLIFIRVPPPWLTRTDEVPTVEEIAKATELTAQGQLQNPYKDNYGRRVTKQTADKKRKAAIEEMRRKQVRAEAEEILMYSTLGAVEQTYSSLHSGPHECERIILLRGPRITAVLRCGAASGEDPSAAVKSLIQELIGV